MIYCKSALLLFLHQYKNSISRIYLKAVAVAVAVAALGKLCKDISYSEEVFGRKYESSLVDTQSKGNKE